MSSAKSLAVVPFKAIMAPATSLFPLAQKFPAGVFFFFFPQEEWNETLCSVTTGFQQGLSGGSGDRKHMPTGTEM